MHRVEGVGVRLHSVVRVRVAGVGGGFHDRQLVKLDESLYRPDILVLYSIIMLYNMMIRKSIVDRSETPIISHNFPLWRRSE